ncbi:MAG: UDP-glucose 4-epimerase GalE [Bdellovibrionota bacterium]
MSKRLLVTGGAGYIGSHVTHQLIEAGHSVTVLDNLYSGHRWAVPEKAEFIEGSVGDVALLDRILGSGKFDGVLHFAAHIEVGESVTNPAKYFRNNTAYSLELFSACVRHKVGRLIFSSTAAVYGEPKSQLVSETADLAPVNPYGASKLMSERILQSIAEASSDLKFVILRYFNVAGARIDGKIGQATPRATHLIKVASEVALGLRDSLSVYGTDYHTPDGTCLRDYIHVEDLSSAHLSALSYLEEGGASDIFNVGYGRPFSVNEVIKTLKEVSGTDFKVVNGPRRAGDSSSLAANNEKIKRVLGWAPKHDDLKLICKTAFAWEKELQRRGGKK